LDPGLAVFSCFPQEPGTPFSSPEVACLSHHERRAGASIRRPLFVTVPVRKRFAFTLAASLLRSGLTLVTVMLVARLLMLEVYGGAECVVLFPC